MKASSVLILIFAVAMFFGGVLSTFADIPAAGDKAAPSITVGADPAFDYALNQPLFLTQRQALKGEN